MGEKNYTILKVKMMKIEDVIREIKETNNIIIHSTTKNKKQKEHFIAHLHFPGNILVDP